MKKLLLLGAAGALSMGASAQLTSNTARTPVSGGQHMRAVLHKGPAKGPSATSNDQNKSTATTNRWYNHAEALGAAYGVADMYDDDHFGAYYMWPDSTVRFPAPNTDFGISYLSAGQMFHPQASTYTDASIPSNVGKQLVSAADAYTVDSVMIQGFYNRQSSSTAVDTLIFTMVTSTPSYDFLKYWYGAGTAANHGQDSFYAMLWSAVDYKARPINQVSYGVGSTRLSAAVTYKMPLTAAVFADSTADGFHFLKAPMNVSVPAGQKAAVSITFKPAAPFTAGTPITNYNYFIFGSHKVFPGGFTQYPARDYNMSSIVTKDTSDNGANASLYIYTPTIAFTSPNFPAEVHAISFKTTCTTCNTVGSVSVKNVNAATVEQAYPNPANQTLNVPVVAKQNVEVVVTLSNPMGQVVASQNLGKVAANQKAVATFNTAGLSNGVYFYTVEVAGERVTNRVVVAH